MGNTFYFDFEVTFMVWLQQILGDVGGKIAGFITMLGEETIYVAILGFIYWSLNKAYGIYLGENLMTALVLNPMVKNIFDRRRPYVDHKDIKCLKAVEADADINDLTAQGYSFPSGHSTNAMTLYGSLALYGKKRFLTVIGIVMPLLIGISRVCLGVHYPTDVLVGWLLGGIAILLTAALRRLVKTNWVRYLILLALFIPGCFYCNSEDYFTALGMAIGFFAATIFEEHVVKFENTKHPLRMVLRVVVGLGLFLGLNAALKAGFSLVGFENYVARVIRYALNVFVLMGCYPALFRYTGKLFK